MLAGIPVRAQIVRGTNLGAKRSSLRYVGVGVERDDLAPVDGNPDPANFLKRASVAGLMKRDSRLNGRRKSLLYQMLEAAPFHELPRKMSLYNAKAQLQAISSICDSPVGMH